MNKVYILLLTFITASCGCRSWGDYELGDNYRLMAGDRDDETILIFCTTNLKESNCCNSGIELVPQMISHVNYNENWIIAKTENGQSNGYWIIKKIANSQSNISTNEHIEQLKSNVTGPLDSLKFTSELQTMNIELELKNFNW